MNAKSKKRLYCAIAFAAFALAFEIVFRAYAKESTLILEMYRNLIYFGLIGSSIYILFSLFYWILDAIFPDKEKSETSSFAEHLLSWGILDKESESQFFILRENQSFGPYTKQQIEQMIASNSLQLPELACVKGDSRWRPLEQVLKDN